MDSMESPTEPQDINLDEKTEFIIDIKHEPIDPDVSIKPKYALVKDVEKEENNGKGLDSSGGIKSEVVDLKSKDEKYSSSKLDPEKLEEETKLATHVKRIKVANSKAARIRIENVCETAYSEAPEEGDKGADRVKIHKCAHCDYSTRRLNNFKRHLQGHKTVQDFQCAHCSYQTSIRDNLIQHVSRHRKADQVTTFKCTECGHQSRRLDNLKQHLKRHNRVDEVMVYKCRECDYQTIRAYALKRHHLTRHTSGAGQTSGTLLTAQFLLKGKSMKKQENNAKSLDSSGCIKSEEVDLKSEDEKDSSINFGAEKLEGETRLANHVTEDEGADIVKIHKCDHCDYRTVVLHNLRRHLLRHKIPKDFQCAQCGYQMTTREKLRKHILRHKNPDQVRIYKCKDCDFQTKRPDSLKQHLKRHKTVDELIMYKCHECDYQTFRIHDLKRHGNRHTSGAGHTGGAGRVKLKKHKCVECNYATDRLHCLKRHSTRHASEPEGSCV